MGDYAFEIASSGFRAFGHETSVFREDNSPF